MPTTLVVTNDFPPRIGGIESFVSDVCDLLDHDVRGLRLRPTGAALDRRATAASRWSGPARCCCRPRATAAPGR